MRLVFVIGILLFTQYYAGPVAASPAQYRVFIPSYQTGPTQTMVKRGVSIAGQRREYTCKDVPRLGGWYYDWGFDPILCNSYQEAVPMIWGRDIPATIGGNSRWLMGGNECDGASQCNTSPDEYAQVWRTIEDYFPKYRLVAPVPADLTDGWLDTFYRSYQKRYGRAPRFDALAMHCYTTEAVACKGLAALFKEKMAAWNVKELWVTEFATLACQWESTEHAVEEERNLLNFFEQDPAITRYAWFLARTDGTEPGSFGPDCNTSLVDWAHGLTPYGDAYR